MIISYKNISETGLVRKLNEDSHLERKEGKRALFVVADGMGGHFGGEIASARVIEKLTECWENVIRTNSPFNVVTESIKSSVRAANDEIYAEYSSKGKICGTTLALVAVIDDVVLIMNIGDSRIYSAYKGGLKQESTDHVYIEEEKRKNAAAEKELRNSALSERLTSAVGCYTNYKLDMKTEPLRDTQYIICSDGVYKFMSDPDLARAMKKKPDEVLQYIKTNVEKAGARDNFTFTRIDIVDENKANAAVFTPPVKIMTILCLGALIGFIGVTVAGNMDRSPLSKANALYEDGKYAAALEKYKEAWAQDSSDRDSLKRIKECCDELGDTDGAARYSKLYELLYGETSSTAAVTEETEAEDTAQEEAPAAGAEETAAPDDNAENYEADKETADAESIGETEE